jgi:WD40 repeat protein
LWNSETDELAHIFVGADSPSGGIAWSPHGAAIAVAAGTNVEAWHAATGKTVCNIALIDGEAASLAWSPDGKTFAVGQRPLDQPEAPARQLCLYDIATGARTAVRRRDDWNVEQIAWSPDGKRLLVASGRAPTFLAERDELVTHQVDLPTVHWGGRALAWNASGVPFIAGFSHGKPVPQLWRAEPPKLLRSFATNVDGEQAAWLALSADGRFVVLGCKDSYQGYPSERAAYLYEASTGNVIRRFDHSPGHPGAWTSEAGPPIRDWEYVPRYTISCDGKHLARCGQQLGGPDVFDLASGALVYRHKRPTAFWYGHSAFCSRWSPNGESLAVRGEDGAIRYYGARDAWPAASGAVPQYVNPGFHPWVANDLRWSPDASKLCIVYEGSLLDVQSAVSGETDSRTVLPPNGDKWLGAFAQVFSADGRLFAGNYNWRTRVFESNTSRILKTLDAETGIPVAWSPDATQLAVRNGNATEIWDIEANECVRRFDGGSASLVWSPDGSRFVLSASGEATIHDAASGNALHELDDPPLGPAKTWPRLSWSPDSRHIAGRGRIWDAETGEVIARLPGAALAGETGAPAWSPDGATLAYLGPGRAVVVANVAPKVRHSTAQGETLGHVYAQNAVALKGRDSDARRVVAAAGESRPVGAGNSDGASTQGSAALHPGLSNMTPSGSPQVAAMLLTFNRGQVLSIAPSGHYRASPRADELLAYVVETPDGQETLSRQQFAERYGWKNDPQWALKGKAEGKRQKPEEGTGNGSQREPEGTDNPKSKIQNPKSPLSLVQRPAALPGVESWTIARRSPSGSGWAHQPIDLAPDGKWLAQAGHDGVVRLIDAASGKVERLFVGHNAALAAVAFSPDGTLVASLDSVVGNVRVWNASNGMLLHSIHCGRGAYESALYWSPDGALLAIAVQYLPVRLLDIASGEILPHPVGHGSVVSRGRFAWSPDAEQFACDASGKQIGIWSTKALEPLRILEGEVENVEVPLAWSPDGNLLAGYLGTGEIRVWDPASAHRIRQVRDEHNAWAAHLAWLPDNRTIAINTDRGGRGWRLWDVVAGKPVGDIVPCGYVSGFSLGGAGETLALGDQRIGLFEVRSRTLKREIEGAPWAESAAWSPDGRELAVTGDDTAVWSNNKHRELAMLPTGVYCDAEWLPDGEGIMHHGHIQRRAGARWGWDVDSSAINIGPGGREIQRVSPDGKRLACLVREECNSTVPFRIAICDVATARRLVQTSLGPYIGAFAWSPDGALLAAGTEDGKLAIYDSANGNRLAEMSDVKAFIRPIEFSPNGETLAVGYGGNGNGFVRLYEVEGLKAGEKAESKRQKAEEDDGKPISGATPPQTGPHPEGEGVNEEGERQKAETEEPKTQDLSPKTSPTNPKSKIENPKSLRLLRELACNGGPQDPEIAALHWSPDGRTLHVLDRAAVYVFDTATGERLAEAPRLDRTPHDLRPANFSLDGRFLAVATTCTRVWDLAEVNEKAEVAPTLRGGEAVAKGDGLAPPSRSAAATLKLVASVVPLGHGQAVVVSADGHWLGTRGAEKEIVYVIKTAGGQETLTPREFYKRFGWKNDPSKVVLPE